MTIKTPAARFSTTFSGSALPLGGRRRQRSTRASLRGRRGARKPFAAAFPDNRRAPLIRSPGAKTSSSRSQNVEAALPLQTAAALSP